MAEKTKKRLGEILIEDGVLTKEDLQVALDHQKKEGGVIGQILVRLGLLSEDRLVAALGKQLGIPYLPLMNYSINVESIFLLEVEFLKAHMVIPFDHDDKKVFLAVSDPLDSTFIHEIEEKLHLKAQVFIAMPSEILNTLEMAFNASSKKTMKKAS